MQTYCYRTCFIFNFTVGFFLCPVRNFQLRLSGDIVSYWNTTTFKLSLWNQIHEKISVHCSNNLRLMGNWGITHLYNHQFLVWNGSFERSCKYWCRANRMWVIFSMFKSTKEHTALWNQKIKHMSLEWNSGSYPIAFVRS